MDSKKLRIGTRGSKLALVQTELVIDAIRQVEPDIHCETVIIHTTGDKIIDRPLLDFGGKGVFVTEFEEAILRDEIDIAVHSAKDMPMKLMDGLEIVGVLRREDPRDVLITEKSVNIDEIDTPVIGTSSYRRQAQIEKLLRRVTCQSLRGNVDTRLRKLAEGQYDGIILAAAGIKRLKLDQSDEFCFRYLEIDECIPAGGQGIIALEGKSNSQLQYLYSRITDATAKMELELERKALELFAASCHEPIGIFSRISNDSVTLWMMKQQHGTFITKSENVALVNSKELLERMVQQIMAEQ